MKICFLTSDNFSAPSTRYRASYVSKQFNKNGLNSKVYEQIRLNNINFNNIKSLKNIIFNRKYDAIYLQRSISYFTFPFLLANKLFKNKFIFDFDDAIYLQRPKMVSYLIKNSEMVIVSNSYLEKYAKKYNKNTHIIRTSIPLYLIKKSKVEKNSNNFIIGWIGTITNLPYLEILKAPLENLAKKYQNKLEIRIIGPANCEDKLPNIKGVKISLIHWNLETEWRELAKCDIGVMPLTDDKWTKGKASFKLLQYMAVGIPAIGSSVGMNKELIQDGKNGFLCKNDKDWENKIEKLIESVSLRKKLGKEGRKTVEKDYDLEKNAQKLINIIEKNFGK